MQYHQPNSRSSSSRDTLIVKPWCRYISNRFLSRFTFWSSGAYVADILFRVCRRSVNLIENKQHQINIRMVKHNLALWATLLIQSIHSFFTVFSFALTFNSLSVSTHSSRFSQSHRTNIKSIWTFSFLLLMFSHHKKFTRDFCTVRIVKIFRYRLTRRSKLEMPLHNAIFGWIKMKFRFDFDDIYQIDPIYQSRSLPFCRAIKLFLAKTNDSSMSQRKFEIECVFFFVSVTIIFLIIFFRWLDAMRRDVSRTFVFSRWWKFVGSLLFPVRLPLFGLRSFSKTNLRVTIFIW